jgi:hypothetical protein
MLKQEEMTFIKSILTMEFTPALLKVLRKAMMSQQKRKPAVSAKAAAHHLEVGPVLPNGHRSSL